MTKYVFKDYSKIFPALFQKEKARLTAHLSIPLIIEHVGSTAIPELGGKGIIDIAIAVERKEIAYVSTQLQTLGYEFRPQFSTPDRYYFITFLPDLEEQNRRYHIHLTYPENNEWKDFLAFRDYLISHPIERQEYAKIKRNAALNANQEGEKYRKLKEPFFIKVKSMINSFTDRPKFSVYIAMSIDGYIARKDGSIDWLEKGHEGDEDYGFKDFFNSVDALILGRNTYETVSAFDNWPYAGKRVVVLSDTLKEVRKEAELYSGPLSQLISTLHSKEIKHVWIDGGITVSKFLEKGLVDHLTISIIPVILGSGIPLFHNMNIEQVCRLISSQSYPSGLVQLRYEVIK